MNLWPKKLKRVFLPLIYAGRVENLTVKKLYTPGLYYLPGILYGIHFGQGVAARLPTFSLSFNPHSEPSYTFYSSPNCCSP